MSKSKKSPSKRKIPGLLRETERATYRMLAGPEDPHYALHTMAFSVRHVPTQKKLTNEDTTKI